ncbi:putative uncharacterized protein [Rhodococcus sp. AW25M09]|uniref:Rv0361 family membrane protein n=1 Tax=Rhodococcus sp. AW25M09 TaxID=1268303 RepID=UPI0002AC7F01|nr:hypothetical protein [Rhodococcus sp. AW25M09]CCQ14913.1 putative uncharacterized protein [Rhodococcus sp. AW25M09]
MPDEKKNAPPEVDDTAENLDPKKKQSSATSTEKIDAETDEPESAVESSDATSEDPSTARVPAAPADVPVESTAKPTAAPRRIPPRSPADKPAKSSAAEKKSPLNKSRTVGAERTVPKQVGPQQVGPQQVGPQRIGPPPTEPGKRSHKKWWAALVAAVVVIGAVAAGAYLLLDRNSVDDSPEARIRSTVESFTRALAAGDLATLRSNSCGDLETYYRDIPDADFADVHRVSVEQGSIPTLDSVDAIQVTDDTTAIAQVIAHTDANPNDRSPRTFDLRLEDDEWKVCS